VIFTIVTNVESAARPRNGALLNVSSRKERPTMRHICSTSTSVNNRPLPLADYPAAAWLSRRYRLRLPIALVIAAEAGLGAR
jgi:hypothetical protein